MKALHIYISLLLVGSLLTSCSHKKKAVEEFATDFAEKVEDNQLEQLEKSYPDIEYADSVAIDFDKKALSVEEGDMDGEFVIDYGDGTSMTVKIDDNDKITVVESTGLFKYPKQKLEFARKTGAIKKSYNDAEMAEAMNNFDDMVSFLYEENAKTRKNAIKNLGYTITKNITFAMEEGRGYYTLKNTTDRPISGSEYTVTWTYTYMGCGMVDSSHKTEKGKDIPANGTVRFNFSFTGHEDATLSNIVMKQLSQDEFLSTYTPTGDEYKRFMETVKPQKKTPVRKGDKNALSDGPYTIVGKIGGKYAVHISLDKGMKTGSYYYDKNGANATLALTITNFNRQTGKLTMEERNDKGEITGTFTGTLTPDSYKGEMTAFNGKTHSFDMKVEQ